MPRSPLRLRKTKNVCSHRCWAIWFFAPDCLGRTRCIYRYSSSPPQTLQRGSQFSFPQTWKHLNAGCRAEPFCCIPKLPHPNVGAWSRIQQLRLNEVIPPASVSVLAPAGREQSTNSNAVIAHSARLQSLFTSNSSENRIFANISVILAYFTVHFNPFPNSYCNFSTFVTEYSNSALIFRIFLPPNRTWILNKWWI